MGKFAYKSGLSISAVSRLVRGERFPTPESMRRISLATDGKVKANDFYEQHHSQRLR